jgi:hypothetical protein|tara:strand:- start:1349 stop:1639 length:291 start_codon:yes stop_codon:yes gene_type:complete
MARARIPYEKMEAYVRDRYQRPLFNRARVNRRERGGFGGFTPIRIYDRTQGNYAPFGWLFEITYDRFTGQIENLNAQYDFNVKEKIVVADSTLDRY